MKVNLMLELFYTLISGKEVGKHAFCTKNGISERTFYRYMNDISCYLSHNTTDFVLTCERKTGVYFLVRTKAAKTGSEVIRSRFSKFGK